MKEEKKNAKSTKSTTAPEKPTKTPVKINVSIKDLTEAMDDMLTIFDWDDVPDMSAATAAEIVKYINDKQDTDDHFEIPDFEVENGKPVGLLAETVRTLISAGVKVPEKWKARLEAVTIPLKPAAIEEKKAKKPAEDPEEQYEEEIDKARKEDSKPAKPGKLSDTDPEKIEKSAKTEVKPAKKPANKGAAGGSKIKDLLNFCEPLFTKGIKESDLMEKLAAKFPQTASATFKTQLYRCRNEKYNQLPKLVVKTGDGILKFAK